MAFSYTTTKITVVGNMWFACGTWTAGTDSNGTITTGLGKLVALGVTCDEAAGEAPKAELNTASDGQIKLTFADASNNTGHWNAYAYSG